MNGMGRIKRLEKLGDISASYVLFCVGLSLWLGAVILNTTMLGLNISSYLLALRRGGVAIIVLSELLAMKLDTKSMVWLFVAAMAFGISHFMKVDMYWELLVLPFCARHYSFFDIAKLYLVIEGVVVAGVVICSLAGITVDYVSYGARVRHFFGFKYTTFLSHYLLNIAALYLYCRRKDAKWLAILAIASVNFLVFYYTDSRNSFILIFVLLVAFLAFKIWNPQGIKHGLLRILLSLSFPLCFAMSWLVVMHTDIVPVAPSAIDNFLSGRLSLTQYAVNQFGIPLFSSGGVWNAGQWVNGSFITVGEYLYVDNSYFNVLISSGAVTFVLFMVLLTALCCKVVRKQDLLLATILAIFAVHSVIDPQMLSLNYCGFLLLFGTVMGGDYAEIVDANVVKAELDVPMVSNEFRRSSERFLRYSRDGAVYRSAS